METLVDVFRRPDHILRVFHCSVVDLFNSKDIGRFEARDFAIALCLCFWIGKVYQSYGRPEKLIPLQFARWPSHEVKARAEIGPTTEINS